tara:strand:+ start:536 stop:700 length:165 start_codon:yes stop_codon:yes gene_type:complete
MIRLPQPTTLEGYLNWARQLVSILEIQQNQSDRKTSVATQEAEDNAEAKAWFNG